MSSTQLPQIPPVPTAPVQPLVVNPDTLITVKVSYNGGIRRFKLPLRELGPEVLPRKLKAALGIPEHQNVRFERYSDSAASFVVLDSNSLTVYKQLYRAAKAKLKLRLKATMINDGRSEIATAPPAYTSQVSLISPPPTTDESSSSADNTSTDNVPALVPTSPAPTSEPVPQVDGTKLNEAVAEAVANYLAGQDFTDRLRQNVQEEVGKQVKEVPALAPVAIEEAKPCAAPTGTCTRKVENRSFLVYCNSCQKCIDGEHFHCSVCDKGDYDLCTVCVEKGAHCDGDHWLIKRTIEGGRFVSSTTEYATSSNASDKKKDKTAAASKPVVKTRTCNSCIACLPERYFVTCNVCEDYDICLTCHFKQKHGHNPAHAFTPATSETSLNCVGQAMLSAGRAVRHHAVCDGCETTIVGVRHKCVNCPDWDYCAACVESAGESHPGHKFIPIYEAFNLSSPSRKAMHRNVMCDGPLCKETRGCIAGDRYKCAVCSDVDFCANCEASPLNDHNRTHPLIKMKTPIASVSCFTTENPATESSTLLGDIRGFNSSALRPTSNAATQVQTVADVEPSKEFDNAPRSQAIEGVLGGTLAPLTQSQMAQMALQAQQQNAMRLQQRPASYLWAQQQMQALQQQYLVHQQAQQMQQQRMQQQRIQQQQQMQEEALQRQSAEKTEAIDVPVKEVEPLQAEYLKDMIEDGTVFTAGDNFQQIWTLTNTGANAWPAGVTVRFVGGDHMFRDGSEDGCESTVTAKAINPGETASFTVSLSAPHASIRRVISYWRLTDPNGSRFGHKLWCDIEIKEEKLVDLSETIKYEEKTSEKEAEDTSSSTSSQMIFPQLDKESQILSAEEAQTETETESEHTLLEFHSPAQSPAWTVTLSEEEGHTSDAITSEDDVDSLMLDDEDYEVLETSDDDGFRRVI